MCFTVTCIAQVKLDTKNYKAEMGAEYPSQKNFVNSGFFTDGEKYFVSIHCKSGSTLLLNYLDDSLNFRKSAIIDISTLPRAQFNTFIQLNHRYWWFYEVWDNGNKKQFLFAQEIDLENAKFKGSPKQLIDSKKLTSYTIHNNYDNNYDNNRLAYKYMYTFNNDSSRIVIMYVEAATTASGSPVGVNTFDGDLQPISKYQTTIDGTNNAKCDDIFIDKKDNVYIVVRQFIPEAGENSSKATLHVMSKDGTVKQTDLDMKVPFIRQLRVVESNNEIFIAGFYSNHYTDMSTEGICIAKLRGEGKLGVVEQRKYEIPIEVLKQYKYPKRWDKIDNAQKNGTVDGEVLQLQLNSVNAFADGGILLVGEVSYAGTETYYSEEIIATKIGADKKMAWCVKLPKSQSGSTRSYIRVKKDDDFFFIFPDHVKNMDTRIDDEPYGHTIGYDGVLTCTKLNSKGQCFKSQIFEVKLDEIYLEARKYLLVGNELFNNCHSFRRGKDRVLKVTIN